MNNLRGISASSPVIKVERKILDLLNVSSASPEIQLRGLHIANIYFNEGKYDLAIRHIKDFMTAKPNHYPGWILLGKIYEKKQQYGDAIDAFKLSFNIREDNTLLVKICDLLVKHNKSHKNVNISDLKYWCTKIEKIHNKHEIYFNLKKIILSCAPENERSLEEMVVLIKAELVKKPHNVDKRLELVKLYVDNSMIGDAYSYVVSIEDKQMHVDSSKWYKCLCNVYVLYAVNSQAELNFNIKFVSAVCALLTLTFSENTDKRGMIRRLDEWIQKVTSQLGNRREFKLFIDEMKAQFYFIIGVVLLKKDSQAMESNPILVDLSAMCFAASNSILPLNTTSPWWKKVDNKAFYDLWAMRANHRSSQCGNVLNDMIEQNDSNWIKMLERDYANKDGHMKLYSTLYGNSSEAQHMESFLFKSTTFIDLNIKTTSADTLVLYNNVSEDLYPNSLHLVIWRLLHSYSSCDTVIPKIEVNVFANLHLGEKDISRNDSIESLCKYDIEAFVCLTLYCSACVVDKKMSALGKREGYPVIMPDGLGDLLCSEVQQSFWTAVYNFYNNTKISTQNTTQRQLITSSLSVLRMRDNIATTGLDPRLYIQLARYFQYRWEELLDTERELPYRRARALYYWTATIDIITSTQKIEEWKSGLAQRQLNPLFILVISETDIKDTLRDCAEEGRLLMERITACEKKQVIENAFQNLSMYSDATLDDIEPFTDMDAVSDIAYSHQTPTKSTQKSINKSTYESSSQQSSINSLYMDQLSNLLTKMGRMEEKLDTALGRISDLEKNVEKNMRLNSDPVSQPLSATPSTPNMVSQQHYANHLMQQNLFTPNQYGQQFQAPMNYQSPMHNIPPQNMQNYPQMDYGRMPQRPPVRMPMQPAAQPPAPQPIVYNDEEYITIDDNLDLDSAYAAIENQYGDCGFMNQQQTKENVPAKQANISGRHQKNADIANLEVEFPSNTNQLMSKESPMQQLMQESQSPDSNLASMKPRVVTATSKITSPSVTSAPTVTANKTLLSTPVKIPPGLWECEQCSIRNGIEVKICIACQSLRPGQGDSPKTDTGTTGQDITSSALFGKKPLSDQKSFFKPMPSGSKFTSVNATPTIVTTSVQTSTSTVFSQVTSSSSKPVPSSVPQDAFKFNFSSSTPQKPVESIETKTSSFTFSKSIGSIESMTKTPEKSMTETPNKKLETDLYVDEGNDGEHIFFEPICKLRDDFVMMTGEESEDILFENRAKLYRFNNNQWKERGLGDIKVLRNKDTKRGRIVMRREHILKICLNAAITPDMELMEMNVNKPGTSWIFQADDFSDGGEVQRDRFAIKFKLPEAATKFKNAIQDFIEGNLDNSESNDEQVDDDKTTVIENNEKIFESTPTEVSKITFGSQIEPKNEPTFGIKSNGPSVISETYSFSEDVTKSTFASILKDNENSPSGFAFGKKDDNFTFTCGSKFFSSPVVADKSLNNSNAYDDVETEDRNLHFDPICHLEEVTDLKTGEEGSECVFDERSKMYRFDSNGAWKERGIGQLKILVNNETGRARIIHRREHILKLAANHLITKDMSIKYLATNLKALCWTAVDYSQHPEENEADDQSTIHDGKPEQISAKFKTDEQAAKFVKLFNHYRDVAVTTATTTTQLQDSTSNAESENYTDYEDEEEEDDNDAEESVYEERCVAKYSENNSQEFINIGDCTVSMSISVDSTFLRLTLLQDYSGDIYASHPISMNSQIKMLSVKTCEWTADDEATEIIVLRTYRLTFQTADEASMYMDKFNEGIQFAEENHNNSEQLQV